MLEKRSLSTNSETPISCLEVSAKATPTVLTPSLTASLSARMTGAASISVWANSSSSTLPRFPGLALFPKRHLVDILPPSDSYNSIRSCFVVSASRRNDCATAWDKVTDGRPSGFAALILPSFLMTVWVYRSFAEGSVSSLSLRDVRATVNSPCSDVWLHSRRPSQMLRSSLLGRTASRCLQAWAAKRDGRELSTRL